MIDVERKSKLRVVYDDNMFIAFAPYASRGPFEILITPCDHIVRFEKSPAETIRAFAACLRSVLSRLYSGLNTPPFNYWIHTLPCGGLTADRSADRGLDTPDFHWHVELIPRLTTTAGFEFGTGIHINTSSPESAAQYIREIKP